MTVGQFPVTKSARAATLAFLGVAAFLMASPAFSREMTPEEEAQQQALVNQTLQNQQAGQVMGDDAIAASWGLKNPTKAKFWMDDPKTYAAAQQVQQGQVSKAWTKKLVLVAGFAVVLGFLLIKLRQ